MEAISLQNTSNTVEVNVETDTNGLYLGHIDAEADDQRFRIPAKVTIQPEIDLTFQERLYVQKATGNITATVDKTSADMQCETTFTQNVSSKTYTAQNGAIQFQYNVSQGTHQIGATTTCQTEFGEITTEDAFQLTHYPTEPFTTTYSNTLIDGVETLQIENNLDIDITPIVEFQEDAVLYTAPGQVLIPPNHVATVYLYQNTPLPEPRNDTNTMRVSTLGYETSQPLEFVLNNETTIPDEPVVVEEKTNWFLIGTLVLLVGSIGGAIGTYAYNRGTDEDAQKTKQETQGREEDEPPRVLAEIEAFIDEATGTPEDQTREELQRQGYSEETISEAETTLEEVEATLDQAVQETQ
jgi:hypothetical protein